MDKKQQEFVGVYKVCAQLELQNSNISMMSFNVNDLINYK